jgi:hypothetical protein
MMSRTVTKRSGFRIGCATYRKFMVDRASAPHDRRQCRAAPATAFLAAADSCLSNPYIDNPFELDRTRNAIYSAGYGERYLKDGKISVTLHSH